MEIKRVLVLMVLIIGLAGCGVEHKVIRNFKGKKEGDLVLAKGKPLRTEINDKGQTIYIYQSSKRLKAAPINTGQFQYDRFESPKATKTDTYKFFINSFGIIEDVTYDVDYKR